VESGDSSLGCGIVGEVLWGDVGEDRGDCDDGAFVELLHGGEEGFDCVEVGEEVCADGPVDGICQYLNNKSSGVSLGENIAIMIYHTFQFPSVPNP